MQSEFRGLHVAIIMDGNGRWATRRGLPRMAGHRAGVGAVRRVVEHAPDLGIQTLTLYAFSCDNWSRPAQEVESIFWLFRAYLRLETERLRERGARLEFIGRRDRLPALLRREIERAEFATATGRCLRLRVAVDYSSRDALARVVAGFDRSWEKLGGASVDQVRGFIDQQLTSESGNVDLLIRTGGEKRLSDFLLWESAYAELLFTDCPWPDFNTADLDAALDEFRHRERRFGRVPETVWLAAAHPAGGAQ